MDDSFSSYCPFVGARMYLFCRSAAVLGSSNISTPKTRERHQISPARNAAAPEDGRTPFNEAQMARGDHWVRFAFRSYSFSAGTEPCRAVNGRANESRSHQINRAAPRNSIAHVLHFSGFAPVLG